MNPDELSKNPVLTDWDVKVNTMYGMARPSEASSMHQSC